MRTQRAPVRRSNAQLVHSQQPQDADDDEVQRHNGAEQAWKHKYQDARHQGDQGCETEVKRHDWKWKSITP